MNPLGDTIGSILRRARLKKELRQKDVAENFALHVSAVANIEMNRLVPAEQTLLRMGRFLEISEDEQREVIRLKEEKDKTRRGRKISQSTYNMGVETETTTPLKTDDSEP